MNIGIVTFFKANNYGAVLQCYALANYLRQMNHDVCLVDVPLPSKETSARQKLRAFLFNNISFKAFRDNHLPVVVNMDDSQLDVVIFGSDQVWNPEITKEYFLKFFGSEINSRKISYAASFGLDHWPLSSAIFDVKRLLNDFDRISVREVQAKDILINDFSLKSEHINLVVDPTLLFDIDAYMNLYDRQPLSDKLSAYIFDKNDNTLSGISTICDVLSLKFTLLNDFRFRPGITSVPFPSVRSWLSHLYGSSFVITDSFHCMVFAILMNKDFIVIPANKKRVSRITSLLKQIGLSDRFYMSVDEAVKVGAYAQHIDYESVNKKLSELRVDSRNFIDSCL